MVNVGDQGLLMQSTSFLQIDEDLTAKLDMAHTRFSFMDNEKVFRPNWVAPEGEGVCVCKKERERDIENGEGRGRGGTLVLEWSVEGLYLPALSSSPQVQT